MNFLKNIKKMFVHFLNDETGAMNFGVGVNGVAPLFAYRSYFYEDQVYRAYVTRIALDFYTGRQDNYIWYDLQRQFRNPEKQQIIPYNITQEIIDETSILYREEPVYVVTDSEGKKLDKDTKLWKKIRRDSRYHNLTQQLDGMTKLLGTVLVKVSFVDPQTGDLVNANKPGMVQFDIVYGGNYTVKWNTSPYFITELEFGFGDEYGKKKHNLHGKTIPPTSALSIATKPTDTTKAYHDSIVTNMSELGSPTRVLWSVRNHEVEDEDGKKFEGENPYGVIPAVPFFNQDPGNRYFLPINEPLIYANHAINMRLSDLNHIVKYQSFGQAVLKGIERPINNRLGRPTDDFNVRGGSRTFAFGGGKGGSPTGLDRNFFNPFDYYKDGNAQANQLGFSLGPDSLVSVGETGDFKYESPQADINGLVTSIYTMMDMLRINNGLRPKHNRQQTGSGYNATLEKLGVVEKNKKREQFFKEREQQLFQVVKKLWNIHHSESKEEMFSEEAELDIHYVQPEFAVDPQTRMTSLQQEQRIVATGDKQAIKQIKPHLSDEAINELLENYHKDRMEQAKRDTEVENYKTLNMVNPEQEEGNDVTPSTEEMKQVGNNGQEIKAHPVKNPAKHSEQSSIQKGDPRETDKEKRRKKQEEIEKRKK